MGDRFKTESVIGMGQNMHRVELLRLDGNLLLDDRVINQPAVRD